MSGREHNHIGPASGSRRNRTKEPGAFCLDRAKFLECPEKSPVMFVAVRLQSATAVDGSLCEGLEDFLFQSALRIELAAELILKIVKTRRDELHMIADFLSHSL